MLIGYREGRREGGREGEREGGGEGGREGRREGGREREGRQYSLTFSLPLVDMHGDVRVAVLAHSFQDAQLVGLAQKC